jgi:hypothetical protein
MERGQYWEKRIENKKELKNVELRNKILSF